jgi:hypothetical protein
MPERQPPHLKKKLSGIGEEAVEGSCILSVGTKEEIVSTEEKIRAKILSDISQLKTLYQDLKDMYNLNKENFDKEAWDRWAEKWRFGLKKLTTQFTDNYSQASAVPLFSKAYKNMPVAASCLLGLYSEISAKLKGKTKPNFNNPKAEEGWGALEKEFLNLLSKAKEEVSFKKENITK